MDSRINAVEIMNAFAEKRLKENVHEVNEKYNRQEAAAEQRHQLFDAQYQQYTQELKDKVSELEQGLGRSQELTNLISLYQTKFLNNRPKE